MSHGTRPLLRAAVALVWATAVWVALWGQLTTANVMWGLVLGAVTLRAVPLSRTPHRVPIRPLRILQALGFFLWSLVKSSVEVAWEVVTPHNRIEEGIIEVALRTRSRGLITVIANAISLTPGTLTLEARPDPPTLWVHVLHLGDIDDARAQVRRLESVMLAAFGDDEEVG